MQSACLFAGSVADAHDAHRLRRCKPPSWGRVLAATGSIPLSTPLDPARVSVSFIPSDGSKPLPLLVNGEPEQVDEVRAKEILSAEDLEVQVELGLGAQSAKYWTCDFSYVRALTNQNVFPKR